MRRRFTIVPLAVLGLWTVGAFGADAILTTFAGSSPGFAGDGGPATQALMTDPSGVTLMPDGGVLVADTGNDRVRRIAPNGTITTVAGTGSTAVIGDGGPATAAGILRPMDVIPAGDGGYDVADAGNHRIRHVAPGGIITTLAGTTAGFAGDGGPATAARFNSPEGLARAADGALIVADTGNHRVRRIAPSGTVTTIAGGAPGFSGDGGPATSAQLTSPRGLAVMPDGSILIADVGNARVRRIAPDGTIATVAGPAGDAGGGEPAIRAALGGPSGVMPLGPNGGFVVTDARANRVVRVTPLGALVQVAGTGQAGLAGDGGPAPSATLRGPTALAAAPGGGILVADTGNARVRRLSDPGPLPDPRYARTLGVAPAAGSVSVQTAFSPVAIALREPDLTTPVSQVNAADGLVGVSATTAVGAREVATVGGGSFRLEQPPSGTITAKVRLNEALPGCRIIRRTAGRSTHAVIRAPGKRSRRVRIAVRGRFQTIGRYGSAIASGTRWQMIDGCDRTIVRVTEGRVIVRVRRSGRAIVVPAGQTRTILASTR